LPNQHIEQKYKAIGYMAILIELVKKFFLLDLHSRYVVQCLGGDAF
jgi:hypothetical protein